MKSIDHKTFVNLPKINCEECGCKMLKVDYLPNKCFECRQKSKRETEPEPPEWGGSATLAMQ
jgi:hypothetical protein